MGKEKTETIFYFKKTEKREPCADSGEAEKQLDFLCRPLKSSETGNTNTENGAKIERWVESLFCFFSPR